jgi:hypothetical protein
MQHDGPCDCDTADRHEDVHGTPFYGRWDGMQLCSEDPPD